MKKAGTKERRNNGQVNKKRNAKKRFPKETAFAGADDETRTRDLILTKDVRYLLCHISRRCMQYYSEGRGKMQAVFLGKVKSPPKGGR